MNGFAILASAHNLKKVIIAVARISEGGDLNCGQRALTSEPASVPVTEVPVVKQKYLCSLLD